MRDEDAIFALAGSIVDRSHDLIEEGWVKGKFFEKVDGAPVSFCILGALELAFEELFGVVVSKDRCSHPVHEFAVAFILDEALHQHNYRFGSIPGFNDSSERTLDQVLGVLRSASSRLWDLSVSNDEIDTGFDMSKYVEADVECEPAKNYLQAVLA